MAKKEVTPVAEEEIITESVAEVSDETAVIEEVKTTKAGKRSAKAVAEHDAEVVRKEKIASGEETVVVKKQTKTRSRIERAGKKYREVAKLVDRSVENSLKDALELAIKTSTTKFDSSIELHVRLSLDPKHADQNIRDNFMLPEGTGKSVRVAVFADGDDLAAAKKAGADIAGAEEFLATLDKGEINFDVLIATPALMAKLGKYARVLGPKGLMPNPKSGTVTKDVEKAVKEAKAGKVEYRVDSTGIVHIGVGKVSFGADRLATNARTVLTSIKNAKPSSVKGSYVKSMYVTSTMGPSIKVLATELA
jgi:large subunit ribosomal protein L1